MIKLGRLIAPGFMNSLSTLAGKEIPIQTAWKLKGIAKQVTDEVKKHDEMYQELLNKYGNKDDAGKLKVGEKGEVNFSDENFQSFQKDYSDLLGSDVEVGSVKLSELGSKLELSGKDLIVLDGIIEEKA